MRCFRFHTEFFRGKSRLLFEEAAERIYVIKAQRFGDFRKRVVRIRNFVFCRFEFFIVRVFYGRFAGSPLKFAAERRAVGAKYKSKLVKRDFFEKVCIQIVDDALYRKRGARA